MSRSGETQTGNDIVLELSRGNKRYLQSRQGLPLAPKRPPIEVLLDDRLLPAQVKAVVISDARMLEPLDNVFDQGAGELMVVRVCGYVCSQGRDIVTGSVEFALSKVRPRILLVLGNSGSDPIRDAVESVRQGSDGKDCMALVRQVRPSAADAAMICPSASFEDMCAKAAEINVWKTMENILKNSSMIADQVKAHKLEVHGAYLHTASGRVTFFGIHPGLQSILMERPLEDMIRTAGHPSVPPEVAHAMLYAGNQRYASGKGGRMKIHDEKLLIQLAEGGQNPIAVVLGCADSRAPIETLFDVRPGDLFVLRNAGNTCSSATGSMIGSAEYALSQLGTKLIIVTGHTKCGAVTAAVDAVRKNISYGNYPSNIGAVLQDILEMAREAVQQLPGGTISEQVALATKLNVFHTIERIIKYSSVISTAVKMGDVQIHGAVYDIFSGSVEWLGQHSALEEIVGQPMPLLRWRVQKYTRTTTPKAIGAHAKTAIAHLQEGNMRFVTQTPHADRSQEREPLAVVVGGAELRVPIENIFDTYNGELIVHRIMGSVVGRLDGTVMASIEYAVVTYAPKLLLVLVADQSSIMTAAVNNLSGADDISPEQRVLVDRISVGAVRAMEEVARDPSCTVAGRVARVHKLATELNALYMLESMLKSSVILEAAKMGLELHAAIVNESTGVVDFVGQHPMLECLLTHGSSSSSSRTPSEPKAQQSRL